MVQQMKKKVQRQIYVHGHVFSSASNLSLDLPASSVVFSDTEILYNSNPSETCTMLCG